MRYIKKGLLYFVLIASILGVSLSLFKIYSLQQPYKESKQKYEKIASMYTETNQEEANENKELIKVNNDYLGWINIDGTNIDYPVVQTEDNDYYLDHNFFQESDDVGAIYMDYRNIGNTSDKNIIIYGHNMKDGSMFANLRNYLQEDYLESHREIALELAGEKYVWEIFSVYETYDVDWMKVEFSESKEFEDFSNNMMRDSYYPSDITLNSDDQMITLATCTTGISDERMVVHGKLKKETE